MIFEELGVRLIEVYEMVAETMMNAFKNDLKTVKELIKKYRFTMVEWFNITG